MPNTEQARKQREAEAYRREEQVRAERKKIADAERQREMKALEKRRSEEMAMAKQNERKQADNNEYELKSLKLRAELGDKKAIRELEERAKTGGGPRPFTGSFDDD
jgi:hypothetical protein